MVTAACIGTFVLAESGLLDHQRATTTWWLAPLLRRRYPKALLDESNMIVESERFVTAGAALSHMPSVRFRPPLRHSPLLHHPAHRLGERFNVQGLLDELARPEH